jgi:hypothetical protein
MRAILYVQYFNYNGNRRANNAYGILNLLPIRNTNQTKIKDAIDHICNYGLRGICPVITGTVITV